MKRQIIHIDEEKCTGCGLCVPECHEGALQIIDGKARLISDLFCDGLGACIGHCPEGAIILEEREAEPYDEVKVMEQMLPKGVNTILAHLKHLDDHKETKLLQQAIGYLKEKKHEVLQHPEYIALVTPKVEIPDSIKHFGGCPGSKSITFEIDQEKVDNAAEKHHAKSELTHWPVQMHLVNPEAAYYRNADVVLAADCVAFSMGNFHQTFLKGKSLAIACPKLDSNKEIYIQKLISMIDRSEINTLSVVIMEVPCCGGLIQLAQMAAQHAERKIPIKKTIISIKGEIQHEEWV